MKVDVEQEGSVTILLPHGALTEETMSFVQGAFEQLPPGTRLVVSLREVPYCDSPGLELLCDLNDRLAVTSRRLKLAEAQDVCREIFDLTDLSKEFEFYASIEDAVRSFL
jgi:anti-anti-sigma factor